MAVVAIGGPARALTQRELVASDGVLLPASGSVLGPDGSIPSRGSAALLRGPLPRLAQLVEPRRIIDAAPATATNQAIAWAERVTRARSAAALVAAIEATGRPEEIAALGRSADGYDHARALATARRIEDALSDVLRGDDLQGYQRELALRTRDALRDFRLGSFAATLPRQVIPAEARDQRDVREAIASLGIDDATVRRLSGARLRASEIREYHAAGLVHPRYLQLLEAHVPVATIRAYLAGLTPDEHANLEVSIAVAIALNRRVSPAFVRRFVRTFGVRASAQLSRLAGLSDDGRTDLIVRAFAARERVTRIMDRVDRMAELGADRAIAAALVAAGVSPEALATQIERRRGVLNADAVARLLATEGGDQDLQRLGAQDLAPYVALGLSRHEAALAHLSGYSAEEIAAARIPPRLFAHPEAREWREAGMSARQIAAGARLAGADLAVELVGPFAIVADDRTSTALYRDARGLGISPLVALALAGILDAGKARGLIDAARAWPGAPAELDNAMASAVEALDGGDPSVVYRLLRAGIVPDRLEDASPADLELRLAYPALANRSWRDQQLRILRALQVSNASLAALPASVLDSHNVNLLVRTLASERRLPQAVSDMLRETGLSFVSRVHPDVLTAMLAPRNRQRPLAVFVVPSTDHNRVFDDITDVQRDMLAHYDVRVIEAGRDQELVERLLQEASGGRRISLLVIGGHGNPEGIRLGRGSDEQGTVDVGDGRLLTRLRPALAPDATVVLSSCSTGREDGRAPSVARVVARHTGARVLAPDRDTILMGIDVTERQVTGVRFSGARTRVFEPNDSPATSDARRR